MKRIVFPIILAVILAGCSMSNSQSQEDEGGILITGSVSQPEEGVIVIEQLLRDRAEAIDTIELNDDNTFSHRFAGEPGYYRLNFYNKAAQMVILDQDDIKVTYDGSQVKVEGSRELKQIEDFFQTLNNAYREQEASLTRQFNEASRAGDKAKVEALREEYMALQKEKQQLAAHLLRQQPVTLATYQLLSNLDKDTYLDLRDSLAQILNEKYPNRFYIEDLLAGIEKTRATAIGQIAPEIALPNPEGEIVPLSSLRGKVVLVDFWAQWCKPCRMENPNVVKAYHKYKDKGFTVYGVSLDRSKDKWLQAIEEDGLTWTHVSDLQYFNSEAARTYGVEAIPFSILLDREGRIIAKNLRGSALDKALAEYFAREEKGE